MRNATSRADALRRTGLLRRVYGYEKVLMAELSLQGRFYDLPTGVPAGSGGLTSTGAPLWLFAAVGLGAIAFVGAGAATRREN